MRLCWVLFRRRRLHDQRSTGWSLCNELDSSGMASLLLDDVSSQYPPACVPKCEENDIKVAKFVVYPSRILHLLDLLTFPNPSAQVKLESHQSSPIQGNIIMGYGAYLLMSEPKGIRWYGWFKSNLFERYPCVPDGWVWCKYQTVGQNTPLLIFRQILVKM
jgi:hypothetical protein